jgi:iron complex transport system substrate-binding protein
MKHAKKMTLLFAALLLLFAAGVLHGAAAEGKRVVVDLMGRSVTLANDPQRLVALVGPTSEKLLLLGAADRIVGKNAGAVAGPWALEVYPRFKEAVQVKNAMQPNVEEMMALHPDVLYFWSIDDQIAKMTDAGIPVVCAQLDANNPTTIDEFIDFQKQEVGVIAESLGGDAAERAKKWCDYFDARVRYVRERTSGIPAADRKKVYYARSDEALTCFSKNSYPQFFVEIAGGVFVARDTDTEVNAQVSLEQIARWNPDVIFMGRMDSTDAVTKDARWAEIAAVKNGEVHLCPNGVMFWDYSSECVLMMQVVAKTLYPDLFADLDIVKETKDYYRTFYDYELSDENAKNLLSHRPPVGK